MIGKLFVIPFDNRELPRVGARLLAESERMNRRFGVTDGWIAATAIRHGIPLLTHDEHFLGREAMGLDVISYVNQ